METQLPFSTGDKGFIQLFGTNIQYSELLVVKAGQIPGTFHFTCHNSTRKNLRVLPTGLVDRNGATGPYATWFLEYHQDGKFSMYTKNGCGKPNTSGGVNWYLGYKDGVWVGNTGRDATGQLSFLPHSNPPLAPYIDPLTPEQKEEFIVNGFLVVKNVIPQELVQNALRKINSTMGTPEYQPRTKAEFSVNVRESGPILAPIIFPQAFNIVQSLLGENNVVYPEQGQIALLFPLPHTTTDTNTMWHEGNHPFSLLFGVCLSDQSMAGTGNLSVLPGSHFSRHALPAASHKASLAVFSPPKKIARRNLQESPGSTQVESVSALQRNASSEYHLLLSPGDVVVVHPRTAIGVGQNLSANIHYQLFYRMRHKKFAVHEAELPDDLFLEYEGIKPSIWKRTLK